LQDNPLQKINPELHELGSSAEHLQVLHLVLHGMSSEEKHG